MLKISLKTPMISWGCSTIAIVLVKHAQNPGFDSQPYMKLGLVVYACKARIQEAGGAMQSHSQLHRAFEASLGCVASCLNKNKTKWLGKVRKAVISCITNTRT